MDIFKSRRFWTAVGSLIAMVIVAFVPELESVQETLVVATVIIAGFLIGGYSAEDVFRIRAGAYDKYAPTK